MIEQHRAFAEQMVDHPINSAWIGVASPDNLTGENSSGTRRRHGHLDSFEDRPVSEAFVWMHEKNSWAPELWVAPTFAKYRPLYDRFIEKYWTGGCLKEMPDNNVDHIFPKTPGKIGELSHVRLLAVPSRSNQIAGILEKKMKLRNIIHGPRSKQVRLATIYSLGKAVGYVGYSDLDTVEGRKRIAAGLMEALRQAGISEEVTESWLEEELLAETLDILR